MFCTCCPTSYQFFDRRIYSLFLTENFQGINIENQPITYILCQIGLLIFIRLKEKIKDPSWILWWMISTKRYYWKIKSCHNRHVLGGVYYATFPNKIWWKEQKHIRCLCMLLSCTHPSKGQIYLIFPTMKSQYTLHTEYEISPLLWQKFSYHVCIFFIIENYER